MTRAFFPYALRTHHPPREQSPAFEASGLKVHYQGTSCLALDNLTIQVPQSSKVALVGPNGAGKSTLLKVAAGLLNPSAGKVRIFGNPVGACHHRVAYLPQRGEIDWSFPISLSKLVLTGRYVHTGWLRWPGKSDYAIAQAMLEKFDLSHLSKRQIGELSGGQQQRALLARALAQEADLLLLDEPLNALDTGAQVYLYYLMDQLALEGKTLVVATHDRGNLDARFDSVVHLEAGRILEISGNPCARTN